MTDKYKPKILTKIMNYHCKFGIKNVAVTFYHLIVEYRKLISSIVSVYRLLCGHYNSNTQY